MIILIAAATDLADGKIARTFHQISKVGRALDPLADKAMQGVMIACLMPYYPLAELVLLLLFVKELMTMAAGWKVIMETETDLEAQWHGKLNTAVTYIVVLILTAGARLPYSTANVLIGACAVCMIMSFVMYMSDFRRILAANGLVRSSVQSRYDGGWMQ